MGIASLVIDCQDCTRASFCIIWSCPITIRRGDAVWISDGLQGFLSIIIESNLLTWTTALNRRRVFEAQTHSVWPWSHARSPDVGHCGICSQSGSWRTISTIAFRLALGRAFSFKNEGRVVWLSVWVSHIKLTAALCWCIDTMHTAIFHISTYFNSLYSSSSVTQDCRVVVSARASHDYCTLRWWCSALMILNSSKLYEPLSGSTAVSSKNRKRLEFNGTVASLDLMACFLCWRSRIF